MKRDMNNGMTTKKCRIGFNSTKALFFGPGEESTRRIGSLGLPSVDCTVAKSHGNRAKETASRNEGLNEDSVYESLAFRSTATWGNKAWELEKGPAQHSTAQSSWS